jgi:3-phenylpropionate/cinnamic acid dioxygenase small subunit
MIDDHESMQRRVRRLRSEFAFAEDPPSRTRRLVGNVRVRDDGDAFAVRSNLLLFRARLDGPSVLLSGERRDRLRPVDGELRLACRIVLLDHTVLPMENLAVFL